MLDKTDNRVFVSAARPRLPAFLAANVSFVGLDNFTGVPPLAKRCRRGRRGTLRSKCVRSSASRSRKASVRPQPAFAAKNSWKSL